MINGRAHKISFKALHFLCECLLPLPTFEIAYKPRLQRASRTLDRLRSSRRALIERQITRESRSKVSSLESSLKGICWFRRGHIKKTLSVASITTRGHDLFLPSAFNAALEYAARALGVGFVI